MAKKILLTGAGFSKAFNGYLCNELTAYFFNALAADEEFREDILGLKPFGGRNFEMLLSDLRRKYKRDQSKISKIEEVLKRIFRKMCDGMSYKTSVPSQSPIVQFFYEFDCIFTTNQDEIQNQIDPQYNWKKKFNISYEANCNGRKLDRGNNVEPIVSPRQVLDNFTTHPADRMYVELHGAYNWRDAFILGDGALPEEKKITHIRNNPILNSYFDFFEKSLCEAGSSLVVVGYGFLDQHINEAIAAGISAHGLKIFIWDPSAEIYLERLKKNVDPKKLVLGPEDFLEGIDSDLLRRGLRGYLPKGFNLEGDDKEDVKRFLKH